LNVKYSIKEKLLLVEMTEEIDHHTTEEIRRKVENEITRHMPRKIIFDFNKVGFMDSAGIGMIVGRYKTMKMIGGEIELKNVKPSVQKIFEMSGINQIIQINDKKIS